MTSFPGRDVFCFIWLEIVEAPNWTAQGPISMSTLIHTDLDVGW